MSAPDERTVQVDLAEPQNTFLYVLGSPLLFPWPRHVYDERGPDWSGDLPLVGNGPFVLAARETAAVVDQREGGRMTLSAAPHWYGARGERRRSCARAARVSRGSRGAVGRR